MNKHHPFEIIFISIFLVGFYHSKNVTENKIEKIEKQTQTEKQIENNDDNFSIISDENYLIENENEISKYSYQKVGKYLYSLYK